MTRMTKPDDRAAQWERLARHEPYFPVLANGESTASDAFFQTGEDDIAALLAAITTLCGREPSLESVLDFGCGAGRLTLPLARRAGQVLACDIAPTILSHAQQNAERAGLTNVRFHPCDDVLASTAPSFDFVCSLLVFQYIPPSTGYPLIRSLTERLKSDGIAALQLRLHQTDRLHRLANLRRRASIAPDASVVQTYRYDERLVARAVEQGGGSIVALLPAHDRVTDGAVLVVRKVLTEPAAKTRSREPAA